MITAKEAKTITDNCTYDKSKYYLTALNRNIKRAAADGKHDIIMKWQGKVSEETESKVTQTLLDNGFEITLIPASHCYEYGAIRVMW